MSVYPSVGFYFKVTLDPKDLDSDNGFQEVSEISITSPSESKINNSFSVY